MKTNELRIGNLIYDRHNDREGVVMRLNAGELYPITYSYDKAFECSMPHGTTLEGIPLTEEWLIKFGFFKYNHGWVLKEPSGNICDFDFSIYDYASEGKETMGLRYNSAEFAPQLEYVHQLQNLYFALTQTELNIK